MRIQYNNDELGYKKKQKTAGIHFEISTERESTWMRAAGVCPEACLVGERASLSRAVCRVPEDDSL